MKFKKSIFMILIVLSISFSLAESLDDLTLLNVEFVNQDPLKAVSGEVVRISLGFENLGGKSIENVILEVENSFPFNVISGIDNKIKVGTIDGYQDDSNLKIINFDLLINKDATMGNYPLKIKYYENNSRVVSIKYFDIDIVGRTNAQIIELNETQINLGKIIPIKFTINNIGNSPMKDIVFEWEDESGVVFPIGSDNNRYINYLESKDSQDFEFNVTASSNSVPGLYKLNLNLKYINPITLEETLVNTITSINVGGDADFDILLSDISSSDYSFNIMNIGNTPAYSISMKFISNQDWKISGVNTVVLGNLESGDYTSTSISITKNSIQNNPLLIELSYTNSNGIRKTILKEVYLNTEENNFTSDYSLNNNTNKMNFSQEINLTNSNELLPMNGFDRNQGRQGFNQQNQQTSFFKQYGIYLLIVILLCLVFVGLKINKKRKIEKLMRNE